ncbi:MAG: glycerol-3-phosphate 1-O-acyltransferase PlsY [Syntrophomonadaceae bacterium]|jgi:glycerol-3-phosphate acyltransferase PlsY
MREILIVLVCYLIGAIPFSYISARILAKTDVRIRGSGNVGTTNVLRTSGIKAALLALIGDLLKGVFAAWLGLTLGGVIMAAVCSLAAIIGHCFPIYLKFKGGKAVATAGGAIFFLMPKVGILLLAIFVLTILLSRYVSLGSILAALTVPFASYIFNYPWPYVVLSVLMAVIVLFRHRVNIIRLRQGNETKVGSAIK